MQRPVYDELCKGVDFTDFNTIAIMSAHMFRNVLNDVYLQTWLSLGCGQIPPGGSYRAIVPQVE